MTRQLCGVGVAAAGGLLFGTTVGPALFFCDLAMAVPGMAAGGVLAVSGVLMALPWHRANH